MANRDGTVWRVINLWDVMLINITGLDGLDITANESPKLQFTFRSDYWDDSAQANPEVFGPIYMGTDGKGTYSEKATKTLPTLVSDEGYFTNSLDPQSNKKEEAAAQ